MKVGEAMSRYIIQAFHSWLNIHLQFVPDQVTLSGPECVCRNVTELVDSL